MKGVEKIMYTAPCRFCGQIVQFEGDHGLTETQRQEEATMTCTCEEAREYQKKKLRKERAIKNVQTLFGEEAEETKQVSGKIVDILRAAVEEIYTGELARVTVNLRGGVKGTVSQNGKGEINVERIETKKQKLTE